MTSKDSVYLSLLPLVFLVTVQLVNCYEVHSMEEFSTQHTYSDNVERELTPPNPGWVDPFDMLGKSATQNNLFVQSDVDNYVLKNRLKKCESYMRRFINLFLRSITGTSKDKSPAGWIEFVNLEFSVSLKEFNILQEFGEHGECGDKNIELVSEVLSNILSESFHRERNYYGMNPFLNWIQNMFTKLLNSPEWTVVISISLLFLSTAWLVYRQLYRAAFLMFTTTMFLCGVGFTWIRMYEEKELEKYVNQVMHGDAPYHCQGKHLEWYEHMYYRMFGTDCHEFYKIRDVRSIVKVSPTDVLLEAVSSMIVIPSQHVAEAYGKFIYSLTSSVPFWLRPLALMLGAVVPLLLLLILLCFWFEYRISVSWTGLHFAPVLFQSREPLQSQTRTRTKQAYHNYIEELPQKDDTKLQSSTSCESELSENKKPLFVIMNILGLKKLVSSTETTSEKHKDNAALTEGSKNNAEKDSEVHSDTEEAKIMKQMEEILVLLQDSKNPDQCKRRKKSIFTVTDGSSLNKDTGSSVDDHNKVDLVSSGDGPVLHPKDEGIELKKTT